MFTKLLAFFGKARAFKNQLTTVVESLDRLDDDLDGDGKSELENLKNDIAHLAAESSHWLKLEFDRVVSFGKLQLVEFEKIADRAKRLSAHVKTGE